jgi:hypothetical protein
MDSKVVLGQTLLRVFASETCVAFTKENMALWLVIRGEQSVVRVANKWLENNGRPGSAPNNDTIT